MRRLICAAVAAISLLAPLPVATAQQGDVGLTIQLREAPTDRRDDPRARIYIIDHLQPGAEVERRIAVTNNTAGPLQVALYSAGAEVRDGAFSPLDGRTTNPLSTWTTVTPGSARLAPRETVEALVRLKVPVDAQDGEQYAAVWAETATPGANGINRIDRVGLRLYVSVGTGKEPVSDFVIDNLIASRDDSGNPVVEATVTNTGGRALDMSGQLTLSDGPGGLSAGPFPAELGTTLGIGQSQPVTVVLDKALPAGPWKARIDLQSGLLKRAAEATITFPEEAGQKSAPATAREIPLTKDIDVVGPVAVGVLGLVSLMLLFAIWWLRRRRKKDDDEDEQPSPQLPVQRRAADEQVSP